MNTTPSKLTDTAGKPATPEIQTLEPAETGQTNNAGPCSVQRFVLPVDSAQDVGREGFGLFDFDGFDDDIKAFSAKHKYRVVTESFVMLQLIRSINRLTKELANCNNRSDNSKNSQNDVKD